MKAKVAWANVTRSKAQGGLGIKEVPAWNKASMAQWLFELDASGTTSVWKRWILLNKLQHHSMWQVPHRVSDRKWWADLQALTDECLQWIGGEEMQAVRSLERRLRTTHLYDMLQEPKLTIQWAPLVWNSLLVPKVPFIMWLACLGCLNTKDRVRKYNNNVEPQCCLCDGEMETSKRLFFQCCYSSKVVKQIMWCTGMEAKLVEWESWLAVFAHLRAQNMLYKIREAALSASVYHIWHAAT